MSAADTGRGWYFRKREDASGNQGGPYSWAEMASFAQQGILAADDLVWHESRSDWTQAATLPGLFAPGAAAFAPPAAATVAAPVATAPTQGPPPGRPRRRVGLVIAIVVAALIVLGAGGGAAWWFLGRDGGGVAKTGPDLGEASVKRPDRAALVDTPAWGQVPANQIGIVLVGGTKRKDAEKIAEGLGGSVVGEIEYINAFQIEFPGTTQRDLVAALKKAEANPEVELAFPNQQDELDAEIWGVRQDPFNDPIYGGGAGDGYEAIGVGKAWSYINGSGIELNNVKVGIVDDGLYKSGEGRMSEFGGDVEFEYPDPAAGELASPEVWDDGTTNPAGSHGTGVTTIIAGDPGNGGPSGIAAPLGKKLKVSMINKYTGQYGENATSAPDPNDITKVTWSPGVAYTLGSLVAIKKQVENNAKVINCSFGRTNGSPKIAAAYKKFFEKMAADHPDVIFVCSAGNDGVDVDGTKRFPSGHALPNMITVGAVHNDGKLADFSNKKTGNYEVTLGAPGKDAVVGIKPEGGAEQQDGTSFAAPHVSAAAAILKSINPDLNAGQIKQLLVASGRTSIKKGDKTENAPAAAGGRILALDRAVFTLINQMRKAKGLKELTMEDMENLGTVDAVATTGEPGEYGVRGIVKSVGAQGTKLSISVTGENHAIGGKTTQSLSAPGEAKWSVTLPKDEGTVLVTRDENGAASLITIERLDINGNWSGTFTITDVKITDEEAAEEEGCSAVILSELKGKPLPMTMDISVDENGQGSATGLIDVSDAAEGSSSEPQTYGISYSGGEIVYEPQGGKGIRSMKARVSRSGENLVQKGSLTGGGKGWSMTAVFTLTKPDTAQ